MAAWASGAWGALVWASGAWVSSTTTCAWEHGSWETGAWATDAWQCDAAVTCAWEHGSWATGAWVDGAWQCEGATPEPEPEVTPETPTGGWAAYNAYDEERRRRIKALADEDEADRLEALLIAEGRLPPNPAVNDRITVREYALQADFSRRAQRAIDYALRARTDLAYQLAAREIAIQLEDEEYAIFLLLASL